jgi:NADH:ubiquinone oxidoreductase subunit E
MACNCKNEDPRVGELLKFIDEVKDDQGNLMQVLQKAQEIFGCLSYDVQELISKELKVPMAEIYGVATFYSLFALEPKGEHVVRVCMGTACYVRGAQALLDKLAEELNVAVGKTTEDGKFTLEATRCLGACGLAPVMTIGEKVYGRIGANDVSRILQEYK